MALTKDDLLHNRIGGYDQVEIRSSEGFFRGAVASSYLDQNRILKIGFYWLAKKDPSGLWQSIHPEYSLEIKSSLKVVSIGQGRITATAAKKLNVWLQITFFPLDSSSFDPTQIKGLKTQAIEQWKKRKPKTRSS